MKKETIRSRFFMWLAALVAINFLLIGLALLSFDYYEYCKNPALLPEETEEVLVVAGVMTFLFPVSLLMAWFVSRRLLYPWQVMISQAENISAGRLDERIEVENPSDEIGRLATTLNQTFDSYQNLLDRLQRFSYDASHQLRNPLAAIRTNSEVCLKHPRSDEEYRAVIGEILEDTGRLNRTVEQLLLLARAAGGALEEYRTQVCLQDIARETVRVGQAIGEMRGLSVELVAPEDPLLIRCVPDLLHEALTNLLDNALKVSPDDGRIEIGLSQPTPESVRITVVDSGPGLAPEKRIRVFRPYDRNEASGKESVGLGLAIVADICRAHDGHFGVEDRPGGGCCFWLELPKHGTV